MRSSIYLFGLIVPVLAIAQYVLSLSLLEPVFMIGFSILSAIWMLMLLVDLKRKSSLAHRLPSLVSFLYIGSGIGALITLGQVHPKGRYFVLLLMGIIWSADTGAYFLGRKFGRHKIWPSVSPNKTWEGFGGGILFAAIASLLIYFFIDQYTVGFWLGLAVLVSVLGLLGDLIESKFKRVAGIKDSSGLLPGHGGFLDRFDSVYGFIPFVFLYLYYFKIIQL